MNVKLMIFEHILIQKVLISFKQWRAMEVQFKQYIFQNLFLSM